MFGSGGEQYSPLKSVQPAGAAAQPLNPARVRNMSVGCAPVELSWHNGAMNAESDVLGSRARLPPEIGI